MTRKMKESGIKWIGEIPEEWKTTKIKRLFKVVNGSTPKSDKTEFWDGDIVWITPADMSREITEIYSSNRKITLKGLNSCVTTLVPQDSIIVSNRAPIGQVCIAGVDLCTNQGCKSLIKISDSNNKYYYYFILIQTDVLNMLGRGTTFLELSSSDLANYNVPLPNLKEQTLIATYLDQKCSKIDETIKKQKQVIEKLKEYKQSVITEAVTKGLNPDVKMKDSGIEWIGEIPEHWKVIQMSRLFKERKFKNKDNKENNVLSLSYGNIVKRNVETNMGLLPESFETYNIVEEGNIVLRLTDLQNDHKSLRCGIVKEKGIITSAYVTLESIINVNTNYYYRLLHTFDIMKGFYGMGEGVRQNLKYDGELSRQLFIMPPLQEQNIIADYLDSKCSKIDNAIAQKESLIEKLTEYKKSLIYECVTGKREV